MSDYDRNQRIPGYQNDRLPTRNWFSGSWLAGLIVAILVIVAVGYAFSDRWSTNSGMVEHRASVTDTAPATTPAPVVPAPSASPAAKP
jgi:hypothetical protein